jgi:deazaflavin-dependent oxidoreductase (nitroreductase family)
MGWYAETLKRLGHRPWFAKLGTRVAPRLDVPLYRLTGGRLLATGPPVLPTLLLTTTGRRTGERRTVPLLYGRREGTALVAGSNWGGHRDPAWALNLQADPRCEVQIGRRRGSRTARVAGPEERDELWKVMDGIWPAYATYRRRAGREVKLFVLDPA